MSSVLGSQLMPLVYDVGVEAVLGLPSSNDSQTAHYSSCHSHIFFSSKMKLICFNAGHWAWVEDTHRHGHFFFKEKFGCGLYRAAFYHFTNS